MYMGSGILLSSAPDLLTWAHAVVEGRIVHLDSLEYPYGWGVRKYLADKVIEQSGELPGFVGSLAHYRQRDLTIVVLSNLEVGPNDRIGKALGQIAGGVPVDPPAFPAPGPDLPVPTVAGRFASSVGDLTLEPTAGAEYARWKGARVSQYTWQIEPGVFFVPADGSVIRIVDADTIERKWDDSPASVFKRLR